MITQIILELHEQALENPSGLPESIVMEAVKALGGFYARTGSRRIASLLASAVRNKSLSNENRIFSYIEMLSVLKEPLENFPTNLLGAPDMNEVGGPAAALGVWMRSTRGTRLASPVGWAIQAVAQAFA